MSNNVNTFRIDSSVQGTCDDFAQNPSITFRWGSGNIQSGTLTLSACSGDPEVFTQDFRPVVSVRSASNVQAGPWTCVT